jgi:hypothetical protein
VEERKEGLRNRQFPVPRAPKLLRYMHGGSFARFFVAHLQAVGATTRRLKPGHCDGAVWRERGTEETDVRRRSCPSRTRRNA